MINNIVFLNESWFWPVILCSLFLLAVFKLKEWTQSGWKRYILKSFLAFFGIAALALIALKPALPSSDTSGKFALLTPGYEEAILDSLKKSNKQLKIVEYSSELPLPVKVRSAESVFVLGHGLKDYDLWQLDEVPVFYFGGSKPEGVVNIHYPQESTVGESLVLKGKYSNPKHGNQLVLKGPGGEGLDSVKLGSQDQDFRLAAEMKVAGKFLYSMVEKDSLGVILGSDPVPVKIEEKEAIRILVINSFPTFETRYLKNFLAEVGNEVVVRSQITTGRYKYEFFNTESMAINSLTQTGLESFDLLIIDATSLKNLPKGQFAALENSVRDNGLGVFIQADENMFTGSLKPTNLQYERMPGTEANLNQWPKITFTRQPYRIKEQFGVRSIHFGDDAIMSAYKRLGEGRIATSMITNSYNFVLEGESAVYQEFWSKVFENTAKKAEKIAEWEQGDIFVFQNEPFEFKLRTVAGDPKVTTSEGNLVALKQDIDFPTTWTGTTWPGETGWHSIHQDTTFLFEYYVTNDTKWNALVAHQTLQKNQRYFEGQGTEGIWEHPMEPISPFWFYGVFLMCMGSLWLEPKI